MNRRYIYISVKHYDVLNLSDCPSTGRYGNVQGMRNLYWGKDAFVIRCGAYAYKVDEITFNKAIELNKRFQF